MFFADPAAAFANVAAALRPGARLVLLVWQQREKNEWARAIDAALGDAAQPPPPGGDPFSLGNAEATARILDSAGFVGMRFEDVHEPVFYGHDLDAGLAFVRGFQDTSAALASLSDGEAARTVERLRETLAAHYSDGRGVVLDARSWLITARRRPRRQGERGAAGQSAHAVRMQDPRDGGPDGADAPRPYRWPGSPQASGAHRPRRAPEPTHRNYGMLAPPGVGLLDLVKSVQLLSVSAPSG